MPADYLAKYFPRRVNERAVISIGPEAERATIEKWRPEHGEGGRRVRGAYGLTFRGETIWGSRAQIRPELEFLLSNGELEHSMNERWRARRRAERGLDP